MGCLCPDLALPQGHSGHSWRTGWQVLPGDAFACRGVGHLAGAQGWSREGPRLPGGTIPVFCHFLQHRALSKALPCCWSLQRPLSWPPLQSRSDRWWPPLREQCSWCLGVRSCAHTSGCAVVSVRLSTCDPSQVPALVWDFGMTAAGNTSVPWQEVMRGQSPHSPGALGERACQGRGPSHCVGSLLSRLPVGPVEVQQVRHEGSWARLGQAWKEGVRQPSRVPSEPSPVAGACLAAPPQQILLAD